MDGRRRLWKDEGSLGNQIYEHRNDYQITLCALDKILVGLYVFGGPKLEPSALGIGPSCLLEQPTLRTRMGSKREESDPAMK